jgi:hypothetical protein
MPAIELADQLTCRETARRIAPTQEQVCFWCASWLSVKESDYTAALGVGARYSMRPPEILTCGAERTAM